MRIQRLTKDAKENLLEDLLKRSPNNYGQYEQGVQEILAHVKEEMAVLQKYLPEQLKEDEIRTIVQEAIAACGDNVNMGNVMKHVMPKTKGRADGKVVNNIVKELLG